MTTPRLLSDRYELGETLGYGGMSEVHRGMDTRLGRDVAVKVLRADLARDPQFQMRFRREAQNAAALNHPAIVAVYDTGEVQGDFGPLPYIVMEYVEGQTLRDIIKTQGPLSDRRAIEVMADVCAALDFSHRHQIIHRDVKPANIMITRTGAVKVMDFGIARALGEGQNVTQTAAVIGTAQYLSPEQARGEAVDARSDVYAAGCVLFELLTGEPPFTGDSPVAVAYQHVREEPRAPSEVRRGVSPALDAIVLKALSKNPANRYQSAAEMRTDLMRVRSGQTPLAPAVMSEHERTAMMAHPGMTGATRRINGGAHRYATAPAAADGWDDAPRRGRGRTYAIVAAVGIALALVGFVAYQVFAGPPAPQTVTVPDITGQDENTARSTLINAGLRPDFQREESEVELIDKVVRTEPGANVSVEEGARVTVFIGSGPAEATIPRLTGSTVEEAQRELEQRGLVLGPQTTEETADASLVGRIIRSDPEAGVEVPGGTAVAVVVGVELTTVAVPDVTGQDAGTAAQALQQAGFQVEVRDVDGGGQAGSVLGTDPAAGTQVEPGSRVQLLISRGNQVQMPDVRGLQPQQAQQLLRDAGFRRVDLDNRRVEDPNQDNVIIDQSVQPGQTVNPDDEVRIIFGVLPGGVNDRGGGGGGGGGN
ncbi:MAG TPA: Stk1 family PASTA domain-containing Ser/Thr kinase, partial [Pseudonocardia sp.]|nr:Stk1 family PASTA domain-containing Ser/Thr kinase [Pseudonocardia sp.]